MKQNNHISRILLFALCIFTIHSTHRIQAMNESAQTDLIIYSYDRPMQLYALLESIQRYVSGLKEIFVIFRTSTIEFDNAYGLVQKTFPSIHFLKQSIPYDDLKQSTLHCFTKNNTPYIIFGVDDIIAKDYINLTQCINELERTNAHGFFFRLGKNLNYCFAIGASQPLPPLQQTSNGIYKWQFCQGHHDWGYANTLDFTLYRKSDLEGPLTMSVYKTPNLLEGAIIHYANKEKYGLCYETSKIANFPLNMVQTDYPNPCNNSYSTQTLLELFNNGQKIDIAILYQLDNKSAHTDTPITFIPRKD